MDRKRAVVLLAVALLVASAGCVGVLNTDGEGTTTPTPTTTDAPATATPTTTDAPEPPTTTTASTTTTPAPEPRYTTKLYRQGNGAVYDGTATFTLDVTNTGASGVYNYSVTVERREGGDFDRTVTGQIDAGANTVESRTVRIEFTATGTYDVTLNGEHVGTVEVRGLGTDSGGASGSDSGESVGVTVEGEVTVE